MFYTMYLDGLCKRRQWPEPHFHPSLTRQGYTCVVRVNNREYSTDGQTYTSEALARDAAATRAYMICRNFSVNDGMFPGQKPGGNGNTSGVQGMPVAIGVGRKAGRGGQGNGGGQCERRRLGELREEDEDERLSWSSGDSSPRSVDSAVGGMRQKGTRQQQQGLCACRRAVVLQKYERCQFCLRDAGWLPAQASVEWDHHRWQKRG